MDKEKVIPFDEKGEVVCTDCCKNCEIFQCPHNETRCQ